MRGRIGRQKARQGVQQAAQAAAQAAQQEAQRFNKKEWMNKHHKRKHYLK